MNVNLLHLMRLPISTFKDVLINHEISLSAEEHIKLGMDWLLQAQDAARDGGVSIRYSLLRGWEASYPETTGYIIPTFLRYYKIQKKNEYKQRAIDMANWELSIQLEDGSIRGWSTNGNMGSLVFDTGQVIFGLISIFLVTDEKKFIESAIKAGDWLVNIQDDDGCWRRFSFNSVPHSYYSRVAWALAELSKIISDKRYKMAAMENIDWVLSNQLGNGWYKTAGFTEETHNNPITHTIAYTIRGILETGISLNIDRYITSARKAANAMLDIMEADGFFWSEYNSSWKPANMKYSCLTGNAQISIIFLRLYQLTGDLRYLNGGKALNRYLKHRQIIRTKNNNLKGAISGSYPIWGAYEPFSFPNWATKFFVDALILEEFNKHLYCG